MGHPISRRSLFKGAGAAAAAAVIAPGCERSQEVLSQRAPYSFLHVRRGCLHRSGRRTSDSRGRDGTGRPRSRRSDVHRPAARRRVGRRRGPCTAADRGNPGSPSRGTSCPSRRPSYFERHSAPSPRTCARRIAVASPISRPKIRTRISERSNEKPGTSAGCRRTFSSSRCWG